MSGSVRLRPAVALLALVCGCGSGDDVLNPLPLGDGSVEGAAASEGGEQPGGDSGIRDGAPGMATDGPGADSPAPSNVSCGTTLCVPGACAGRIECGLNGDGCGGLLDCGPCPGTETCTQGVCSRPDAGPCIPATCQSLGYGCGAPFDGCGSWLDCGTCGIGQFCGGGGYSQCGGSCAVPDGGDGCTLTCTGGGYGCFTSRSCRASRTACGVVSNGCGGLVDCGDCAGMPEGGG